MPNLQKTSSTNQINDVQKEVLLILSRQKNALSSKDIFAVCEVAVHVNTVAHACHALGERAFVLKIIDAIGGKTSGPNFYAITDTGRAFVANLDLAASKQPSAASKIPSTKNSMESDGRKRRESKIVSVAALLDATVLGALPGNVISAEQSVSLTEALSQKESAHLLKTASSLPAATQVGETSILLSLDEINEVIAEAVATEHHYFEDLPPTSTVADRNHADDDTGIYYAINASELALMLKFAPLYSMTDATALAVKKADSLPSGGEVLVLRAERSVIKVIKVHDLRF